MKLNPKKLVLTIGLFVMSRFSQVTPCEDYACDTLAVRAILDNNNFTNEPVSSVIDLVTDDRITSLTFRLRHRYACG